MLRQCIQQGARQHRHSCRQWSSLPSTSLTWESSDDDDASHTKKTQYQQRLLTTAATPPTHHHYTKRYFSISRHPDPLTRHGTINTHDDDDGEGEAVLRGAEEKQHLTADDLEAETNEIGDFWGDDDDEGGKKGKGGSDYSDIFGDISGLGGGDDDDEEQDEETRADAAYKAKQEEIQTELDARTGRLWSDEWIITDEEWMSNETFDDMEDWKPTLATRKSLESVKVFEGGVPTLQELSRLGNLPASLPPHPGHGAPATYAKHRKKQIRMKLRTAIQRAIHDDLRKILKMESWEEKQAAVDGLFEVIGERVKEREKVLGKLPEFENMVESGLEDVLSMVQNSMKGDAKEKRKIAKDESAAEGEPNVQEGAEEGSKEGSSSGESKKNVEKDNMEELIDVMGVNAEPPTPIFMDILAAANQQEPDDDEDTPPSTLSSFFTESNDDGVPNLLYPLNVHHNEGVGRMVEEWQLAANKETKRIMMRDAMREIASKVVDAANCCDGDVSEGEKGAARVFVAGERGVGKTAALAGIVASARLSGHIVVYLPDGDRLRRHGFYIEPCYRRGGLYNLPEIAKEFCEQLLTSHGDDLRALTTAGVATKEAMKEFLTEDQIRRAFKRAYAEDEDVTDEDVAAMTEMSLDTLLTVGIGSASLSSGCYSTVINILMNQTEKPFTVVMDEFNCYYDHGHYFHMDYDENVQQGVPLNRITIFKPFLDAMGLYPNEVGTEITKDDCLYNHRTDLVSSPSPIDIDGAADPDEAGTEITKNDVNVAVVPSSEAMMKWGSIIVGTSESRAVRASFTQSLTDAAHALVSSSSRNDDDGHQQPPFHVVDIRRFSTVEVQHILYNFEITGIGRLRFDRGDTALNPEEVEYLRLVSGGAGQKLMDACMIRN